MLAAAGEEPAAQGQRAQERRSAGEPCAALSASALWHAAAEAAAFVDALGLPSAAAAAVRQRVTSLELEIAQQQDQLAGAWRAATVAQQLDSSACGALCASTAGELR
jgi:hypothetical protein